MNPWQLDSPTAFGIVGFVYLVMPVTVWFVLRGRHDARSLLAWCGGAAAFGLANVLVGLVGVLPEGWAYVVAYVLIGASYPARVAALQLEMGRRPHAGLLLVSMAGFCLAVAAAHSVSLAARQFVGAVLQLGFAAWLGWSGLVAWRQTGLDSARLIIFGYAAYTGMGVVWLVTHLASGQVLQLRGDSFTAALTGAAAVVAAILGSLGYVGMVVERGRRQELKRGGSLAAERARREAALLQAGQLQGWIDEREEMLRLLAHEVRQPINNAMAALQAAHQVLAPLQDQSAPGQGLRRAEAVLGQIVGRLDNTLAATTLLASPDRVEPRDADVDMLLATSIGDLPPPFRARIIVQRESGVRTATMDAGLMRLALRNLLHNAACYSPPGSPVYLRVSDRDEPLALVFEVADRGPGFSLQTGADAVGPGRTAGGLGLHVVHRVVALHGSSFEVLPNPGGGSLVRLTLREGGQAAEPAAARVTSPGVPL